MNWIKTSDETPEEYIAVLACFSGMRYLAYIDDKDNWCMEEDGAPATKPTHWMPLPELPE